MDIMRDINNTDDIKPETKPKDDDMIITCDLCGSNFLNMIHFRAVTLMSL